MRLRALLVRLALVSGGIFIGLAATEFYLSHQTSAAQALLFQPDPYMKERHPPGKEFDYLTQNLRVRVRFNSLGFHDREHNLSKEPGTLRIVALGDSFLDALQVPREQTFAHRLERELNNRSVRAEVVNLGMSHLGPQWELGALERYGLQFQPDAVLVAFFSNDLTDALEYARDQAKMDVKSDGLAAQRLPEPLRSLAGGFRALFPATYELLRRLGRDAGVGYPCCYEMLTVPVPPHLEQGWNLTFDAMKKMRDRASESGAKFFVLNIPPREAVHPDLLQSDLVRFPILRTFTLDPDLQGRMLGGFTTREAIPYLDLGPGFRDYANRTGQHLYFADPDEAHWNRLGHEVAAALAAERLVEAGVVAGPVP